MRTSNAITWLCLFFPLLSIPLLIVMLIVSSNIMGILTFFNVALFVLLLEHSANLAVWLLVFEVSTVGIISSLTFEGRSFRRVFSLLAMIGLSLIATGIVVVLIGWTDKPIGGNIVGFTLIVIVALIKTPSFPFSLWLPEAHVEASWPGSAVLAGFAMKFATIAVGSFMLAKLILVDALLGISFAGCGIAVFGITSTVDFKKLVAYFSIIHMSFGLIALSGCVDGFAFTNLAWHHHSLATCCLFFLIGFAYASSASRLSRLLIGNGGTKPIAGLFMFVLISLTLDLPWAANSLVELMAVRATGDGWVFAAWVLVVSFVAMISALLKFSTGIFRSGSISSTDISGRWGLFLFACGFSVFVLFLFGARLGFWIRGF